VVIACSTEDPVTGSDASVNDASIEEGSVDATSDAPKNNDAALDAGRDADAKAGKDANGPGEAGAECSFNKDCQSALRCECDGTCACKLGSRGTGENGIDACDSGNDCLSAVCLEGPGGAYLCSDECVNASDCPTKLPKCLDVAFVGRICVRQP